MTEAKAPAFGSPWALHTPRYCSKALGFEHNDFLQCTTTKPAEQLLNPCQSHTALTTMPRCDAQMLLMLMHSMCLHVMHMHMQTSSLPVVQLSSGQDCHCSTAGRATLRVRPGTWTCLSNLRTSVTTYQQGCSACCAAMCSTLRTSHSNSLPSTERQTCTHPVH